MNNNTPNCDIPDGYDGSVNAAGYNLHRKKDSGRTGETKSAEQATDSVRNILINYLADDTEDEAMADIGPETTQAPKKPRSTKELLKLTVRAFEQIGLADIPSEEDIRRVGKLVNAMAGIPHQERVKKITRELPKLQYRNKVALILALNAFEDRKVMQEQEK